MLMAATAYNLKKFLKFIKKDVKSVSISAEKHLLNCSYPIYQTM